MFHIIQETNPKIYHNAKLRLPNKAMNDTMRANGIVPSMIVFKTIDWFSVTSISQTIQAELILKLQVTSVEMETILAENEL